MLWRRFDKHGIGFHRFLSPHVILKELMVARISDFDEVTKGQNSRHMIQVHKKKFYKKIKQKYV